MTHYDIVLGFGANLGDRKENIDKAISMCTFVNSIKVSNFIETDALLPEGATESWNLPYLNCAISGKTMLSPDQIYTKIKKIENILGRDNNSPRWSPRVIDIDILFYDILTIKTQELTIPHPEVFKRNFALAPATECAPRIIKHFLIGQI